MLISHPYQLQGSVTYTSISCGARDMWVSAAHQGQWQKHWLLGRPLTLPLSPAYHLFSHLGWTILFQNDWHVFTLGKNNGYQPRNGRDASVFSMSSHRASGTAAGRHILAAWWPLLFISAIPGPGMFYRMAVWAWPRGLLQMSNLDSLPQNPQGLWTLHDSPSNTKKQWARIYIWKHYFVTSCFLLIILYSALKQICMWAG